MTDDVKPGAARSSRSDDDKSDRKLRRRRKRLMAAGAGAVIGLFLFSLVLAMRSGSAFFVPIAIALVLNFILAPPVRWLQRLRLPSAVAAALVLILLLGLFFTGVVTLAEPAAEWLAKAPTTLRVAERKMRGLQGSVEKVNRAAAEVEKLTALDETPGTQKVTVEQPSLGQSVFAMTRQFLAGTLMAFILLFFLLATGDQFLTKMVDFLPLKDRKLEAGILLRTIERQVSTYLATVTLINFGLGTAIALALYALDMPNPVLWGVMAMFLNFVPYLGAMVGAAAVGLAAALTFDQVSAAIVPPAVYMGFTGLEGMIVTPAIFGKRFALDPVVLLLWLFLWTWIWGIPGTFLAVPMLAITKIVADHTSALHSIARLIGSGLGPSESIEG